MNWFRVPKEAATPSAQTTYQGWKGELAVEARHQCVYCCISEAGFGGFRNFHVEHFRPKSRFPALEIAYLNLFYACAVCNAFKLNDWPSDAEESSAACYLDPSKVDYSTLFDVDHSRGVVTAKCVAAMYLEHRLHLNRPQLAVARRYRHLFQRLAVLNRTLRAGLSSERVTKARAIRVAKLTTKIADVLMRAAQARPYAADQLR